MARKIKEERINVRDLTNAVFRPREEEKVVNLDNDGVIVYTMHGTGDFVDEDGFSILRDKKSRNNFNEKTVIKAEQRPNAFAKKVTINGKSRFFVKQGRNGKFFNPLALIPSDSKQYIRTHGKDEWNYYEVNNKVFKMYLNYLKTKNNAWLVSAERENI